MQAEERRPVALSPGTMCSSNAAPDTSPNSADSRVMPAGCEPKRRLSGSHATQHEGDAPQQAERARQLVLVNQREGDQQYARDRHRAQPVAEADEDQHG